MENRQIEDSVCAGQDISDSGAFRRRPVEVYISSSGARPLEWYLDLIEDYWYVDNRTRMKIRQAMEIYGFQDDFDLYGHSPVG